MNIFRKKCEYCKEKIEKGKEINKNVRVLGFIGLHQKYFCSNEHCNNYEKEVEEHLKKSKSGGSCCG